MRPARVLDAEVYKNYLLILIRDIATRKTLAFEKYEGHDLDISKLESVLKTSQIVTFNGRNYDLPIITAAIFGFTNEKIKQISDAIIVGGMKPWEVERANDIHIPQYLDHIDLIEVAPGKGSLKAYGGRLHSKKIQDLPIPPNAIISPEQREQLKTYCGNDLETTIDLYTFLKPQLDLRDRMTKKANIDLRSKSDAQIAEAVIKKKVEAMLGDKLLKPSPQVGRSFLYRRPPFISFKTAPLIEVLDKICSSKFVVSEKGNVDLPAWLEDETIKIGNSEYRMGIGGLHSTEKCVYHKADENTIMVDRDVTSYYPSIILALGLYPVQMGIPFMTVYRGIVNSRIEAKKRGDKVTADALKITINGSFGKFGSKYSYLYSPNLLIQTTITGQLALLMLIESLECAGIPTVSANTDGVVIKCPKYLYKKMESIIAEWEKATGFSTEETRYSAVYSRDVNNYIAIKEDGVKTKGEYAHAGLQKNPANEVCIDALVAYLKDGVPFEQTILDCDDIRKFVTVRSVTGGGEKNGVILGKAVRWYYANDEEGTINYRTNGNIVPRSLGAKPLMELPDALPDDINYAWYIEEVKLMLQDLGVLPKPIKIKRSRKKCAKPEEAA